MNIKTPFFTLLFCIILASNFNVVFAQCELKYDGIYVAPVDNETDAHIKFFPDGKVLVSTSVKNIDEVKTWFTTENEDMILIGKYKKSKCKVSFTVSGNSGGQKFKCTISNNELTTVVTDSKTKNKISRTYKFVAVK